MFHPVMGKTIFLAEVADRGRFAKAGTSSHATSCAWKRIETAGATRSAQALIFFISGS